MWYLGVLYYKNIIMFWANSNDNISKIRNSYNIQSLKEIENYEIWFIRIHALLVENDLVSYVTISNHDMKIVIKNQQLVCCLMKIKKQNQSFC